MLQAPLKSILLHDTSRLCGSTTFLPAGGKVGGDDGAKGKGQRGPLSLHLYHLEAGLPESRLTIAVLYCTMALVIPYYNSILIY